MTKSYEDQRRDPSGVTAKDAVPDTLDHAAIEETTRGPGHGETHYIPGEGFLISHGGFSKISKGTVYDRKVAEIRATRPKPSIKYMPDKGTYLSEDEVLHLTSVIHAHRRMTEARSTKERFFAETRAQCHPGTDAVDSAHESDESELTEKDAKCAASVAAWNHLVFTANGQDVCDKVEVHVDGYGKCRVGVGENHE